MKSIIVDATGGKNWIGGLYYKKNILFSLLKSDRITQKYRFVLVIDQENIDIFYNFKEKVRLCPISYKSNREKKIKITLISFVHHCKYIFPSPDERMCKLLKATAINWIPDFQHNHLPEMFSFEDIASRDKSFRQMAASEYPLILSSEDARNDFKNFYSTEKNNVYVVPFVSYIEDEIRLCTKEREKEILERVGLTDKKYVCIANQFWKHKNHVVVFEALKIIAAKGKPDIIFAFTGNPSDLRNPGYSDTIKNYLNDPIIKPYVCLLGFMKRDEQIAIMKNSAYMIQPSLFEGWGTVLEDAKVLDKTVLLSDIPVHREQKSEKCILFNPHDPKELAVLIETENGKEHIDHVEDGIADMHKRAEEYAKGFVRLLADAEGEN